MNNSNSLDLEVSIEKVEESTMTGGISAFIFYLKILNLSSKNIKLELPNATYITTNGEQFEQDKWLSGFFIMNGNLKPKAYVKAGLIFYKSKLSQILDDDKLYIEIKENEKKQIALDFQRQIKNWNIINTKIAQQEFENHLTHQELSASVPTKELSTQLLKRVERLEAFEENCKIYFNNVSIKINNDFSFKLFGEVQSSSGARIESTIKVNCILYDKESLILEKEYTVLLSNTFFGFEVFEFNFYAENIVKIVHKIRLYPSLR